MVLIFWGGFGQQNRWYIGPLITLMPLLLPLLGSGLLGLPLSLLGLLFGFGGGTTWVYDPDTRMWRRQGARSSGSSSAGSAAAAGDGPTLVSSVLVAMTTMVVTAAIVVVVLRVFFAARRHGLGPTLRRLLLEGFFGGWDTPEGGTGQQARRGLTRSKSERLAHVARLMQSLPVEVYRSREELERLSVAELKRLLEKRGLECRECLEKAELVAALSEGAGSGGSTAASCIICCEDYATDDVLRVLRCGHRFHLECIDRWLLSSTDYSRPPACPCCNKELA